MLAVTVGFSGATVSMFLTTQVEISDMLPLAPTERKYTAPLAMNVIGSEYGCQILPSNEYSFDAALASKIAVTTTAPLVGYVVLTEKTGVARNSPPGLIGSRFVTSYEAVDTFPAAS